MCRMPKVRHQLNSCIPVPFVVLSIHVCLQGRCRSCAVNSTRTVTPWFSRGLSLGMSHQTLAHSNLLHFTTRLLACSMLRSRWLGGMVGQFQNRSHPLCLFKKGPARHDPALHQATRPHFLPRLKQAAQKAVKRVQRATKTHFLSAGRGRTRYWRPWNDKRGRLN